MQSIIAIFLSGLYTLEDSPTGIIPIPTITVTTMMTLHSVRSSEFCHRRPLGYMECELAYEMTSHLY